jgi:hypothetical protein
LFAVWRGTLRLCRRKERSRDSSTTFSKSPGGKATKEARGVGSLLPLSSADSCMAGLIPGAGSDRAGSDRARPHEARPCRMALVSRVGPDKARLDKARLDKTCSRAGPDKTRPAERTGAGTRAPAPPCPQWTWPKPCGNSRRVQSFRISPYRGAAETTAREPAKCTANAAANSPSARQTPAQPRGLRPFFNLPLSSPEWGVRRQSVDNPRVLWTSG